jgi:hypothetical protein
MSEIQVLERSALEDFRKNSSGPALVILANSEFFNGFDFSSNALVQLANTLNFQIFLCETKTPMEVPFAVVIAHGYFADIPILQEGLGWKLATDFLTGLEGTEDYSKYFKNVCYDGLSWTVGRLLGLSDWSHNCWMGMVDESNNSKILHMVSDDAGEGYLGVFTGFIDGGDQASPKFEGIQFSGGVTVSITPSNTSEGFRKVTFSDGDTNYVAMLRENHLELLNEACDEFGWYITEDESVELVDIQMNGELILSLEGNGNTRTKPFTIPEGYDYFTYSWTTTDRTGSIDLHDASDPSDYVDSNFGQTDGSTNWYGTGRFFLSISCSGSWKVTVHLETDAKSNVSSSKTNDPNPNQPDDFVFWHMTLDNFVLMTPSNVTEKFTTRVRNAPGINFIEDLSRGYLVSSDGALQYSINSKQADSISEGIMILDQLYRTFLPQNSIDEKTGLISFLSPINASAAPKHFKQAWKARVMISKALSKAGTGHQPLMISTATAGMYPFYIFLCSVNEHQEQQAANLQKWSSI